MGVVGVVVHLGVIGIIAIAVAMAMARCLWIRCWRDDGDI